MDGTARGHHGRAWSLLEICAGGIIALDIDDPHVVADLSAEWVLWISHPLKPLPGGTPRDQEDRRGSALPVNPRGCRVNPGRRRDPTRCAAGSAGRWTYGSLLISS